MNGFVNIIKPQGMSSALAVSLVKKKIFKEFGKQSIGHMGTLDPMASGVLPMGINQANRLFDYLLDKQKVYVAEFTFGYSTDTLDSTGTTVETTDFIPTESEIAEKCKDFVGEIDQIPPKFSAKSIGGRRGYELARQGVDFELSPKKVTVLSFDLVEKLDDKTYKFVIKCKGGTYIRSLCRDLALTLGSLAVMSKLDRTGAGIFSYENAVPLQDFIDADTIKGLILPPDTVVSFPKLTLNEGQAQRLLNGIYDQKFAVNDGLYRVYVENSFTGIGVVEEEILKIKTYVRDL